MGGVCGAHSSHTALSGRWLDSWGPSDWNSPGGWPDYGSAKCWRCAGDRNREFSRPCRCDSSHCCCDVPDAATRADCPLDGPILFSASTSLRAKESNACGDSRFVEGKLAITSVARSRAPGDLLPMHPVCLPCHQKTARWWIAAAAANSVKHDDVLQAGQRSSH
jgi:hypothetical protein